MNDLIYTDNQKAVELTLQSYIKNLSLTQMAQVLEFIEYLQFKNNKVQNNIATTTHQDVPPISHYADMIKLPKTGAVRDFMEFDVASMAKDD